jgi:hypothetical protein
MWIKNSNLSWRYQASFVLAGALKGPRGGGGGVPTKHELPNQTCANTDTNYFI